MELNILDAMARGGFEEVQALVDRRSGLRGFLALHDTSVGPALGGIRRWAYRSENEALRDVLRLSRAMTHKCALLGLPAGGGKVVLLEREGVDWPGAYRHLGEVVEHLAGRFYTGPDVGTGATELASVAEATEYVTRPDASGPGLLPEATCEGVFAGMAAALEHVDGEVDWPRRTVVVQGLGAVGSLLVRRLVGVGARVIGAEVRLERARALEAELGIEVVDPSEEFDLRCDVFAPCALGGILHDLSVPRLDCRVVAGSANNVLAQPEQGDAMHRRGILYAPDFVISAGALVRGHGFHLEGRRVPVEAIGERIGQVLRELLEAAGEARRPPARFAFDRAEELIRARREAPS